jgi:predicted TIM-barrel fold metal-dependent hydrolase
MACALNIPIVDAHHHFWDLSAGPLHYPWLQDPKPHDFFLGNYEPLKRNYLPADYRRDSEGFNVVTTVHVEAECDRNQQVAETRWLSELSASQGLPGAIVAHAWFHTDNAEQVLEQQAQFPLVRGIRSKPVTAATPAQMRRGLPGSMQDPTWLEGFRRLRRHNLSWDLRVPTWHLEEAAEVVATEPDIPVVLNHTGFPWDRSPQGLEMWRRGMRALAAHPQVYCKLSCLCLPDGPWLASDNAPLVRETIELFGIERCMFASNFPVDGLRISYRGMFEAFAQMTADLSDGDRRALFHDNACRFYRIDTAALAAS